MHFPRDLVWSRPGGPEVPGPGESSLRLLEAWRAQLLDVGGAELMTRRGVLWGDRRREVSMDRRVRFRFYRSRVFFAIEYLCLGISRDLEELHGSRYSREELQYSRKQANC